MTPHVPSVSFFVSLIPSLTMSGANGALSKQWTMDLGVAEAVCVGEAKHGKGKGRQKEALKTESKSSGPGRGGFWKSSSQIYSPHR